MFLFKYVIVFTAAICFTFVDEITAGDCPTGWADAVSMCYIFQSTETTEGVNWAYANKLCRNLDTRARLPVFSNPATWTIYENAANAFQAELKKNNSLASENVTALYLPLGGYNINGEFYWMDGTKMSEMPTHWAQNEPSNSDQVKQCVGVYPSDLNVSYSNVNCFTVLLGGIVCQLDPTEPIDDTTNNMSRDAIMNAPAKACPDTWITIDGVCYKAPAAVPTVDTPNAGLALCKTLDPQAHLPEFYNGVDFDNFTRFMSKNLHAIHTKIALNIRKNGELFTNSDNTSYFFNWKVDNPSGDDCVFTNDIDAYTWTTNACTEKGYIVCQLDTRTVKEIKIPQTTQEILPTTKAAAKPIVAGNDGDSAKPSGNGGIEAKNYKPQPEAQNAQGTGSGVDTSFKPPIILITILIPLILFERTYSHL